MSIALMAASYRRALSPHLRQVLLILCDHANDDGTHCHPSVPLIAWKLDITERAVLNSLKELERMGVVGIHRTSGLGNHYTIDLKALPEKQPFTRRTREAHFTREEDSPVKPTSRVPVKPASLVPVKSTTETPEADFTLTTNEPSTEPPGEPVDDAPSPVQPFDLLESLCESVGQDVSVLSKNEKGKQLAAAKRLVNAGMTPGDVQRMTGWLLGQSWITSGVDMFLLEKQLGKWQLAGKPARPRAVAQANGRASPFEKTRAAFAEVDAALDDWLAHSQPSDTIETTGRRHA